MFFFNLEFGPQFETISIIQIRSYKFYNFLLDNVNITKEYTLIMDTLLYILPHTILTSLTAKLARLLDNAHGPFNP